MADEVLYFSYGHNTNVGEMHKRVPEARLLGRASVHGYKMSLEHFSDIRPDKNSTIQGVLYAIPKDAVPKLDALEDHRSHYKHLIVPVNYGGKIYKAYAYQMFSNYHDKHLPTKKYINFIAQGYRENKIPLKQLTNALQDRLSRHKELTDI
jgi:gamma-glutamylcyclotransferase (GGCT)/AIG2-like uncharacterized protein YtfP